MDLYYYNAQNGQTYSGSQILGLSGINVETADLEILNFNGLYPVQASTPDFDTGLYNSSFTWSIVAIDGGEGAERVYTASPKPLATAQASGISSVKVHAQRVIDNWSATTGYTIGMLTPVAAQLAVNRPARFAAELDTLQKYSDVLNRQIDYIDAATTVDEVNAVVNPPNITGEVTVNATGNDLDDSFVVSLTGVSADDLSLYFPSTDTTVAYDSGNSKFPATVGVFTGGDYTGFVRYLGVYNLAEFDASAPPVSVSIDWRYLNYENY